MIWPPCWQSWGGGRRGAGWLGIKGLTRGSVTLPYWTKVIVFCIVFGVREVFASVGFWSLWGSKKVIGARFNYCLLKISQN